MAENGGGLCILCSYVHLTPEEADGPKARRDDLARARANVSAMALIDEMDRREAERSRGNDVHI